jgi:plasmid stability protein
MGQLNLRDVPDELIGQLKADAALRGMKLKEYCVRVLQGDSVPPAFTNRGAQKESRSMLRRAAQKDETVPDFFPLDDPAPPLAHASTCRCTICQIKRGESK